MRVAAQRDAVLHRERGGGVFFRRDEGQRARARIAIPLRHRASAQEHPASLRPQEAGEGADQRRLAGGVGADERDRVPLVERETHAVKDLARPAPHHRVRRLEHHRHARPSLVRFRQALYV